jgi:IS605 OrfB family transposase
MLKGNKINSKIKRKLSTLSFYKFKNKMTWSCNKYSRKLYIVTEKYTSKNM